MKDVQCYELFVGIALKNHAFSFSCINLHHAQCFYSVGFSLFYVHTVAVFLVKGLCALRRNSI